jgi:hypothetical protein
MNSNYVQRVKEDLNKLLEAHFIFPIEITQWLSPLVIVPKTNSKLYICVDYQKLNSQTKKDPFPLPFLDSILDTLAGHEVYSFMDGYNGYNQVKMVEENKEKTSFLYEWGACAYNIMPFGLCNALATFQKMVTQTFQEYLNDFMQKKLDDFNVYGEKGEHLNHLKKCMTQCRNNGISFNPKKRAFCVNSVVLLGHVVCENGLLVK